MTKLTPEGAAAQREFHDSATPFSSGKLWNAIAAAAIEASEEVRRLRAQLQEFEASDKMSGMPARQSASRGWIGRRRMTIAELRRLHAASTQGPWKTEPGRGGCGVYALCPDSQWRQVFLATGQACAYELESRGTVDQIQARNAEFISAAHAAVPELLDEIERLSEAMADEPSFDQLNAQGFRATIAAADARYLRLAIAAREVYLAFMGEGSQTGSIEHLGEVLSDVGPGTGRKRCDDERLTAELERTRWVFTELASLKTELTELRVAAAAVLQPPIHQPVDANHFRDYNRLLDARAKLRNLL